MIILPVAISGAGKSTYGEQLKEKILEEVSGRMQFYI